MKLNGAYLRPVYADGVYILKGGTPGLCRFKIRLQQNVKAYGIYGMEDFTLSANNRHLQSLNTLQSSVISILTNEGSKTNHYWTLLPPPKKIQRIMKSCLKGVQNINDKKSNFENILRTCQKNRKLEMCTVN